MHIPVLLNEVLEYLKPQPNENFIDGTFGWGGHTTEILKQIKPNGQVLAIEWDKQLYQRAKKEKIDHLNIVHDSYADMAEIVKREKFNSVSGILLDLGMSSWHIEGSQRGFSFQRDESLDMRYNTDRSLTASVIVNTWTQEDIERILKLWGQERWANRIAANIVYQRQRSVITTTKQLADIVLRSMPKREHYHRVHPAPKPSKL